MQQNHAPKPISRLHFATVPLRSTRGYQRSFLLVAGKPYGKGLSLLLYSQKFLGDSE